MAKKIKCFCPDCAELVCDTIDKISLETRQATLKDELIFWQNIEKRLGEYSCGEHIKLHNLLRRRIESTTERINKVK